MALHSTSTLLGIAAVQRVLSEAVRQQRLWLTEERQLLSLSDETSSVQHVGPDSYPIDH